MYSFDLVTPIDGSPSVLQVVFLGHEDSYDHLVTSLEQLVETYNRRLSSSHLLFICPAGVEKKIDQCFKKNSKEFEGRLTSTSHVVVAPYNERGKLVDNQIVSLKCSKPDWKITDTFLKELGDHAVAKIFDDNNTILYAPHGYEFRKLSGQEQNIFVRAGNMLREPNCLAVFNYLLLCKLPDDCSIIYIDSFTILSFALGLQSLVGYFHRTGHSIHLLTIENIHSYEMDPEFRISNESKYLFLISASTSGGLARKLVDEKGAESERIVHLLGVGPGSSDWRNSCVYFKEWCSHSPLTSTASQQNTLIEISTEEFLISQSPPRPVPITRNHVNSDGAHELHKLYYQKALKFNEPGPRTGGGYSTFSILTGTDDSEPSPLHDWVKNQLVHELPASIHTLIHADDFMSVQVASWINNELGSNVVTKSLTKIKEEVSYIVPVNASIVVVAYFDPNLESLRELNIALRRMEGVHRHYAVGYAFPASRAEHNRFKNDLRMGRSGLKYGWSEFLVLPVGADTVHESLSLHHFPLDENTIEECRVELRGQLADTLIMRVKRSAITWDGLFFPRTNGTPLILRRDSVLFPGESVEGVSQIAVYAMVSSAMQAARESALLAGSNNAQFAPGFDDNPFVRSVLDPSMFARYNDGILQAALLRSAQRSELDYSASDDLSRSFTSICQSVLVGHEHGIGDAALEFVYALKTKKVSLRPADRGQLDKKIKSIPVLNAFRKLY